METSEILNINTLFSIICLYPLSKIDGGIMGFFYSLCNISKYLYKTPGGGVCLKQNRTTEGDRIWPHHLSYIEALWY